MTGGVSHWAARFVGHPWDATDQHCWAFCRKVWAGHFGLDVPEMPVNADDLRATRRLFLCNPELQFWQAAGQPVEGDAVVMARGRRDCHVGIWIEPDGVQPGILHAISPASVFTTQGRLGDLGYRISGFYRRAR